MNLLIVTQYFWPENFRINDLVEGMLERGHSVTVLTGQPNYPAGEFYTGYGWRGPREETYRGARVLRVPLVARGKKNPLRLIANFASFALFGLWAVAFRLKQSERFDAIFVFEISPITVGIPAIYARHKFKAPILFWVLDLWPDTLSAVGAVRNSLALRAVGGLVRYIYRRCDQILVASRAYIPEVLRFGGTPDSIRYFPNWGEQLFDGASVRAQDACMPPPAQGIRIVYTGNIGEAQDFATLLDAATLLRAREDIQWVFVGDGRQAEWVASEVQKRGLSSQISLIPQQPLAAMPGYFASADVLYLALRPGPVFENTIPGKLQSYLAAGKPILAMLDGEGARVLEESKAGFAAPAGNAAELADCVLKIAALSPQARAEMGQNGRDYYEAQFARAKVLGALEGWLQELKG